MNNSQTTKMGSGQSQDDVVNLMLKAVKISASDPYIRQVYTEHLEGLEDDEIAERVFNYAFNAAYFYPDPAMEQYVNTALSTLKRGYANCVDYAVFISTFLTLAGIPHFFRQASFGSPKKYDHIYVKLDDGTTLDPVIGQDQNGQEIESRTTSEGHFNEEVPYKYKQDTKVI